MRDMIDFTCYSVSLSRFTISPDLRFGDFLYPPHMGILEITHPYFQKSVLIFQGSLFLQDHHTTT